MAWEMWKVSARSEPKKTTKARRAESSSPAMSKITAAKEKNIFFERGRSGRAVFAEEILFAMFHLITKTGNHMIVDHAHRLHMRVDNRGTHKTKPAFF